MPAILVWPTFTGRARRWNRGKSTWNVEHLGFKAGQMIGGGDHVLTQVRQILQSLVEAEILHPVDGNLHTQEGGEFSYIRATRLLQYTRRT